eukprot:8947253-Alexandrium_andersonii.AAC.1
MSASLVGSEMCIRDRCSSATRPTRRPRAMRRSRRPRRSSKPFRRPTGGPVSYTHLTLPTICSV